MNSQVAEDGLLSYSIYYKVEKLEQVKKKLKSGLAMLRRTCINGGIPSLCSRYFFLDLFSKNNEWSYENLCFYSFSVYLLER